MWCKRPARLSRRPRGSLSPGAIPEQRIRWNVHGSWAARGSALVARASGAVVLDEGDEIRNREEGGASILDKLGDSLTHRTGSPENALSLLTLFWTASLALARTRIECAGP